jgi:hypothetical protein
MVEDEDFLPPRDRPAPLDHRAVGVGGRRRHLPAGQARSGLPAVLPTTVTASGDGIMVVKPSAPERLSASTMGGGEWPNMAPVSPRQKSM